MITSVRGANRLKRSGKPITDPHILNLLHDIQTALHFTRTVTLRVSHDVAGPVVIGILRPAILLPCSFLTAMPPEIIRAAIAHELAHIRRHDYLVNLGQMLIESLLFFNPCVWWISNQIRIERELCCDQAAIRATGDAHNYAVALDHVAATMSRTTPYAPALTMHNRSRATLLHRVRCILLPGQRSALRLPWYSIASTFLTWVIILTGLWMGSTTGVALAQKVFSDHERIDLIKHAQQKYGIPESPNPDDRYHEPERTTVTGTLRLADGVHPARNTIVNVTSNQPRLSSGGVIQVKDGQFSGNIVVGRIHMTASYPGYAPAFLGPYLLDADKPLTDLEIILHRGYQSSVLVTDEQNNPVTSATVELAYTFPDKRNPLLRQTYETNHQGIATIDHASTHPAQLKITLPGFEPTISEIEQLPQNGQIPITIRRAKPATGIVVDDSTGKPIPNTVLLLIATHGPGSHLNAIATTGPVTDSRGHFVLNNLRDDTVYDFLVEAPPRRPAWLTGVKAGDAGLEVRMGAPLVIRGTISGNPDKATVWDHKRSTRLPAIRVSSLLTNPGTPNYLHFHERIVPLDIKDGIGHFSAEGLPPGETRLMWDAGTPKKLEIDLQETIEHLELSTESGVGTGTEWTRPPAETDQSTRTVVLKFETPSNTPPAGTIYLNYNGLSSDPNSARTSPLPIPSTGNEIRFVIKTPGGVQCSPRGTIGYWFDEQRFQVPAGDNDYIHHIPCIPAGSISGTVLDKNGQPEPQAFVSVSATRKSQSLTDISSTALTPNQVTINNHGRFHITPLPVGSTYIVVVHKDANIVSIDEIEITREEPNQTITAQLTEGKPLTLQLVDEQGHPVGGVPVKLLYLPTDNFTRVISEQLTDRDGKINFTNLNSDSNNNYRIDITSRKDYQPITMSVRPGETHPPITLKRGLTAHGKIINRNTGKPVAGDTAFALPIQYSNTLPKPWVPILAEKPTGPDGTFQFSNLPPGKHTFRVQNKGSLNNPTATAGSNDPIEIQVNF